MLDLFLSQFKAEADRTAPSWLKRIRREGMDRFAHLGLPTTDLEEWRYTSLEPLSKIPFKRVEAAGRSGLTSEELARIPFGVGGGIGLVFVNGHFSPELSSFKNLPQGVMAKSLKAALREDTELLEATLGRNADLKSHPFVALNTAFLEDGAFVFLPKGAVLESGNPITLLFISRPNGSATVSHPRNLIVAEEGAQGTVVESYLGEGCYLTNAVTEVVVGDRAVVSHYKVQGEGEKAFHIASLAARQGRQSSFTSYSVSLGASLARNDIGTVLEAEGGGCVLNGLYLAEGDQHVDHHTAIDHAAPHGTSNELYKGILGGRGQGVFNGKILVRPEAAKTSARQTNKNLLLSDGAIIATKPLLEILNNDVRCNHGATIGRLDENQVFYLRSRGLKENFARSLLTYAFASDLIGSIPVETLRTRLAGFLFDRFVRGPGEAA